MKIFDRYVLNAVVRPLVVTLLLALVVLLIERMLRVLDIVLGARGPLKIIFEMMAYLVPHYVSLALPLGLLLGILLGFRRLSMDSELDAMQSAGVGFANLLRPTFLVAIVVFIAALVTATYLQPLSRYAYRAVIFSVTNASFQALLQEGVMTELDGTTFMMEEISSDGSRFNQVFVHRADDEGGWSVVTAPRGTLADAGEDRLPTLRLFDGVRLSETVESQGEATTPTIEGGGQKGGVLRFEELRSSLGEGYDVLNPRGENERELTQHELWQQRLDPPGTLRTSDLVAEFNVRLVRTISILALPLLAIPLARGSRRRLQFYGLPIGVLILLLYKEVVDFGKNLVESGSDPLVGLWLPCFVFMGGSLIYFLRSARRVPGDPIDLLALLPWRRKSTEAAAG